MLSLLALLVALIALVLAITSQFKRHEHVRIHQYDHWHDPNGAIVILDRDR